MVQHRRARRRSLVPVGAVVTAAGVAVAGGAWLWAWTDDSGSAGSRTAARAPADPRIRCEARGQVSGSGSSAQHNAMKYWIEQYQRACPGVRIAYNPVGSTAGVSQFMRGVTAFGGTDGALKPEDIARTGPVCGGGRAVNLPTVGGPIAVGYNLTEVDDLILDAPTLAKIFDSRITRWNDPAIRALNPAARLPDLDIQSVHRSDGSGTTQNFTAYLSAAAPRQWTHPVSKSWPAEGGNSADGSQSMAGAMTGTHGSIGYVELSYATRGRIPTVRIDTGAAEPVAPNPGTASAGIAGARITGKGRDLALRLDYATRTSGAYPIVLITYEVICDRAALPALKSFLSYVVSEAGQEILPGIHYAPLPEKVATRVRAVVATLP
ncbi:phosphate ABC transporter substrate-binding protein PstS [Streptomyces sp. NBC_00287]|uniref:phosphate ABC transporter substrate-binding protein PstS n=1 Tax=Streptomyces sp. NBC_00287 TaxID=2975702 RepID=UPI002E29486C|nr:phosphate ABC transporter substrate-binding protein PstS [Streptomyces sp. NBC_00287]